MRTRPERNTGPAGTSPKFDEVLLTMKRLTDDEIVTWLKADETASRPCRVDRMHLLLDHFGQNRDMLFFGGVIPAQAFEEMRLAYLNGLYISCVVVSQIVIEHILAGLLDLSGRTTLEGAGFQRLTEEARAEGYISEKEFEDLIRLRRLRNPYTHSRPVMHDSCVIRRAAETGSHPLELFKQDAETALAIVAGLLSRYPFSFLEEERSDHRPGGQPSAPSTGNS